MLSSSVLVTILALTVSFYHVAFADDITSNLLPDTKVCGLQSPSDPGTENLAGLGEFPWSALLEYEIEGKESKFFCGATLINNKYVVTAAHCIKSAPANIKLIGVRLGEHTINNATINSEPPVNFGIDKIIIHNNYTKVNQSNDIALIKLKEEVTFSDYIKPICVPTTSELLSNKYEGSVMTVAGWGITLNDTNTNVKRRLTATGKTTEECNSLYNSFITITDNQLCALSSNDFCRGNGGSSLAIQDDGNWYITGIVSLGASNCKPEYPTVYSRASSYAKWIVDNLED